MVNGWNSKKLTSICKVNIGLTHTPQYVENGVPFLSVKDIKNGKIILDDIKYISNEEFNTISNASKPQVGDILICRVGTLGNPCVVSLSMPFAIFVSLGYLRSYGEVDTYFLHQWLTSTLFMNQVNKKIAGSSQKNLNTGWLKEFEIVYPNDIKEQKAIATALSDMDELIINLEKLIEKKKAIKQGTMQALLTGEKRLPGFSGEWKEHVIGKCGCLQKGSINPQTDPEKYFAEYSMPAFDSTQTPAKVKGKTMHSNRVVISGKVLLFNKLNVKQKRIWLIESCETNAVCSAEFLPYTSDVIDLKLLSQILFTDKVTNEFVGMSTGSSNSQKRITPKAFLDYTLFLPTDIEEQSALADVFNDMDNEIIKLENQLEKYRLLKQGMMQKLLTGEIRLV